ncbi:trypsin-like serine peptidase [Sorangium sp. So ce385]|uniref:trypsin-like serine peptidase n=1 Tax=Sorangium sp. So ce385 TaxID=3133308 RepID=UPI003F5CA29F
MKLLRDDERRELLEAAREGGLHRSQAALDTLADKLPPAIRAKRVLQPTSELQLKQDVGLLADADLSPENEEGLRQWLAGAADASSAAGRARFGAIAARRFGLGAAPIDPIDARDELPQKIVITDKTVSFDFLLRGHEAGAAVGCVVVPVIEGGKASTGQAYGTAWLLTARHVVTCLHALHARPRGQKASPEDLGKQAIGARVHFSWSGPALRDEGVAVKALVAHSEDLDAAILELDAAPAGRAPLACDLRALAKPADEHSFVVNIIQHPRGKEKRVGLRANAVLDVTARDLFYFTDTDEGASGAPVMDDGWSVLALHRGASFVKGASYLGKTIGYANVGTRITAILAWLKAVAPEVHGAVRLRD